MNKKKRTKLYVGAIFFCCCMALGSIFWLLKFQSPVEPVSEQKVALVNGKEEKQSSVEARAQALVKQMSDAEKIGQMMIVGVHGVTLNQAMQSILNEYKFGGVVLFDRNMETPEQVKVLNSALQKTAAEGTGLPLFIGVDEEGGHVVRMEQYLTAQPSAARLGRQGDSMQVQACAVQTAEELKALGFNVNFAPVLDLGLTDERSYGDTVEIVTEFARSACSGYAQEKMIFSLKHFPGIGKTKIDPHADAYELHASREVIEAEDIAPFKSLIQSMAAEDFFVMVSHLKYPALDKQYPASLSQKIITDLLKNQYGFKGLVITDDMEMGALSKYYAFEELGVMAAAAGADLMLVCHDYNHEIAVYNGMLLALQEGRLDRAQIDRSVIKIVAMKLRLQDRQK